ncbi:hypothetical protein, partial [Rhizobium leguminosarum]|uniref:hypothetical protein n=1 Tax=Rhizobium leguminosarum TaxID=384 RepID=UPI003F9A92A7
AHWLSHVDYDLESPVWRPWLQALSAHNRFVRRPQDHLTLPARRHGNTGAVLGCSEQYGLTEFHRSRISQPKIA